MLLFTLCGLNEREYFDFGKQFYFMFKKPIFQNTVNKHRTQNTGHRTQNTDTEHRTQTHVKNVLPGNDARVFFSENFMVITRNYRV